MRVLFTGGGTIGPVSPLLAVYEELKTKKDLEIVAEWIGTRTGPEKDLITKYNMPFHAIHAGKLRRYLSIQNFLDPFLILIGIIQSLIHVSRFKPDIIISAGGFVAVPVVWAGWLMNKKSILLQVDITPGLANLLCVKQATKIGVATKGQLKDFPEEKTEVVGIPTRSRSGKPVSKSNLGLDTKLPVVLVVGGGTGSGALNTLIEESVQELTQNAQVVHITGKGKKTKNKSKNYVSFEFLKDEFLDYLQAADLVVSRAGMGALSEFSYYGKPSILIPLPKSPQVKNAQYFEKLGAAIYMNEGAATSSELTEKILSLLKNKKARDMLAQKCTQSLPHDASERVANMITKIVQ